MPDLKTILDPREYALRAGPDWPSLAAICAGLQAQDPGIQAEVAEYIQDSQLYWSSITRPGREIAEENRLRQGQVFYNKHYQGTVACGRPWDTMGINTNGDVYICDSPSWLPRFVGNIVETDDIYTVLNSDQALQIRTEILGRTYHYCNDRICSFFGRTDPVLYADQAGSVADLEPLALIRDSRTLVDRIPRNLIFDFDSTCNFQCPSCRTQLQNWNTDHRRRGINDRIVAQIKRLIIDRIDQATEIRWCGGEPFISAVYLDLLDYCAGRAAITHTIQTNGSYLSKHQDLLTRLLPTVTELRVSFDAASSKTYAQTRQGGDWALLLANVRRTRELIDRAGTGTRLVADFVVQQANYQEIPAFVALIQELGMDSYQLQRMWNWATWPQAEFDQQNVYNPAHPEYPDLVQVLAQIGEQPLQ
jgi:organic radical activating enzyme